MDAVQVVGKIYDQQQQPLIGATVLISLNRYDQDIDDKQYITPINNEVITDGSGEFTLSLWKSSEGARSTSYTMQVYKAVDIGDNGNGSNSGTWATTSWVSVRYSMACFVSSLEQQLIKHEGLRLQPLR
jgi:hypothetical protein